MCTETLQAAGVDGSEKDRFGLSNSSTAAAFAVA
jgi:hypothetical protein